MGSNIRVNIIQTQKMHLSIRACVKDRENLLLPIEVNDWYYKNKILLYDNKL